MGRALKRPGFRRSSLVGAVAAGATVSLGWLVSVAGRAGLSAALSVAHSFDSCHSASKPAGVV